jgi:hypothetical protein
VKARVTVWLASNESSTTFHALKDPSGFATDDAATVELAFDQLLNALESFIELVLDSSMSNPLQASVTGSWSKRGSLFADLTIPKVLLVVTLTPDPLQFA